jgi:hypothetical protein
MKREPWEYFDKIYTECVLRDRDLFTNIEINMMSEETALIMIESIEVIEPVEDWEKNLIIRIKDIKGIF